MLNMVLFGFHGQDAFVIGSHGRQVSIVGQLLTVNVFHVSTLQIVDLNLEGESRMCTAPRFYRCKNHSRHDLSRAVVSAAAEPLDLVLRAVVSALLDLGCAFEIH